MSVDEKEKEFTKRLESEREFWKERLHEQHTTESTARKEQVALLSKELEDSQLRLHNVNWNAQRMQRTLSWRITYPLRLLGKCVRMIFLPKKLITAFAYAFFGAMKDLWIDFGKPAPKLIHFVRYRIFHRLPPKSSVYLQTGSPVTPMPRKEHPLPPDIPEVQSQKETEPQAKPNGDSIAVCIYCQDQHRTEETIRSVVSQSLQPAEIVILDESAQADSIALQLHENTIPIRLIRGTWNSPSSAFNAAVSLTNALYISCLQSGDVLHRGFLQCAYDVLTIDDRIGATYADVQEFAGGKSRTQYPDILNIGSTQTTLIPFSCLLLRRKALVDGNAWQNGSTEELLNIMLSNNWKLIKNPGMLFKQHVADTLSPASV